MKLWLEFTRSLPLPYINRLESKWEIECVIAFFPANVSLNYRVTHRMVVMDLKKGWGVFCSLRKRKSQALQSLNFQFPLETCNYIIHCACVHAQLLHSCPTLCNSMNCSPPGSSVHGILQARILEWVVMPFSRGSSQPRFEPRSPSLQADSLPTEPSLKVGGQES